MASFHGDPSPVSEVEVPGVPGLQPAAAASVALRAGAPGGALRGGAALAAERAGCGAGEPQPTRQWAGFSDSFFPEKGGAFFFSFFFFFFFFAGGGGGGGGGTVFAEMGVTPGSAIGRRRRGSKPPTGGYCLGFFYICLFCFLLRFFWFEGQLSGRVPKTGSGVPEPYSSIWFHKEEAVEGAPWFASNMFQTVSIWLVPPRPKKRNKPKISPGGIPYSP